MNDILFYFCFLYIYVGIGIKSLVIYAKLNKVDLLYLERKLCIWRNTYQLFPKKSKDMPELREE